MNGIWGGYTGEGAKTVIPVESLREILHAPCSEPKSEKNRQARRTPCPRVAAEDCDLQFRSFQHRQAVGRAVLASDFPESDSRASNRLRQESRLHSRRWLHSFRHANVRHLQSSLRASRVSVCPTRTPTLPTNTSLSKIISAVSKPLLCSTSNSPQNNFASQFSGLHKKPILSGFLPHYCLRSLTTVAIVPAASGHGLPQIAFKLLMEENETRWQIRLASPRSSPMSLTR